MTFEVSFPLPIHKVRFVEIYKRFLRLPIKVVKFQPTKIRKGRVVTLGIKVREPERELTRESHKFNKGTNSPDFNECYKVRPTSNYVSRSILLYVKSPSLSLMNIKIPFNKKFPIDSCVNIISTTVLSS